MPCLPGKMNEGGVKIKSAIELPLHKKKQSINGFILLEIFVQLFSTH